MEILSYTGFWHLNFNYHLKAFLKFSFQQSLWLAPLLFFKLENSSFKVFEKIIFLIFALLIVTLIKYLISYRPLLEIQIDENLKILTFKYQYFFIFYETKNKYFNDLKIEISTNENFGTSKIIFLNKSNQEICYIENSEGIFNTADFNIIYDHLNNLTTYSNKWNKIL